MIELTGPPFFCLMKGLVVEITPLLVRTKCLGPCYRKIRFLGVSSQRLLLLEALRWASKEALTKGVLLWVRRWALLAHYLRGQAWCCTEGSPVSGPYVLTDPLCLPGAGPYSNTRGNKRNERYTLLDYFIISEITVYIGCCGRLSRTARNKNKKNEQFINRNPPFGRVSSLFLKS